MSFLHNQSHSDSSKSKTPQNPSTEEIQDKQSHPVVKLAPSMWLRAMTDFDAPFGQDGLPTVWG